MASIRLKKSPETMKAVISRFITIPYTEQELEEMAYEKALKTRHYQFRKVIQEETLDALSTNGLDELRNKVLQYVEQYAPMPIMVRLEDNLRDSFILATSYDVLDPSATFEMIVYSVDDPKDPVQNPLPNPVQKAMMERMVENINNTKRIRDMPPEERNRVDEFMKKLMQTTLTGPEYDPYWKMVKAFLLLNKDTMMSLNDAERIVSTDAPKHELAPSAPSSKPHYIAESKAVVLCRIFGKDWEAVDEYKYYFQEFYNASRLYDTSNTISPTLHSGFKLIDRDK